MTDSPHILVIGAGLIGLCTADALAARGARVTLLDKRPGPCEGTSFSNSGMIHPSQARCWSPKTRETAADRHAAQVSVALAKRSTELILQKSAALGLPNRTRGCVQLQPDMQAALALQAANADLGIRTDILIDADTSFGHPACHFPDDASGDARAFGCALEADLVTRGVSFLYGVENFAAQRTETGFHIETDDVQLAVDHLVIAAGTATPAALAQFGVRMTLTPVSGAAADFDLPSETAADTAALPRCPVMDVASRSAVTIFEDRVRISGGWNVTDPQVLLQRWAAIAPEFMARLGAPRSVWTSQRPVSPVGRPYIDATSVPGLWVNTGHGHMGWTLCAGSGELLAQMILEGRAESRFAFAG